MTLVVRLALAVFATYRVTRLVVFDDGPMVTLHGDQQGILKHFRRAVGRQAASSGGDFWMSLAELIHCPFCTGVWIAAAAALCVLWPHKITDALLVVLGIAGGQSFLEIRK